MDQSKKKTSKQVFYNDRWVDIENFRVFVYNSDGQKLAESYQEYENLIASGKWFSTKNVIVFETEKSKANE